MSLGLPKKDLELIRHVLTQFLPKGFEVWAFGSRVDGSHRSNSDLDLLIEGPVPIDRSLLIKISEAFEVSSLGPKIDLLEGSRLSHDIRNSIDSQKKVRIYP